MKKSGSQKSKSFLGFVIAAMGAALGFNIDYGPGNPLAYVAQRERSALVEPES